MYPLPHVEPMSKDQLRQRAFEFYLEYVGEVGTEYVLRHGISFDDMYEMVIYPKYGVMVDKNEDLGLDDEGTPILGKFLPKDNTALVDKKLFETCDPRRVFTECHEVIGHGILHGPFLRKNARKYPKLYSTEKGVGLNKDGFMWKVFNTFERQANTFAANVAAPPTAVLCLYRKMFGVDRRIKYTGPSKYSLCLYDNCQLVYAGSPLQLAWVVAKKMQLYFGGLSAQALAYQVLNVAVDTNGYNRGGFRGCEFASSVGEATVNYVMKALE